MDADSHTITVTVNGEPIPIQWDGSFNEHVALGKGAEGFTYRGAGFDGHSPSVRVEVNALHGRDIDYHLYIAFRDESLQTMPAACYGQPPPLLHGIFHGSDYLVRRADKSNMVRTRAEPLVETLIDHTGKPGILGPNSEGVSTGFG